MFVFSLIFIVEQIIQTHPYFSKYMDRVALNKAIRKTLSESPSFQKNNNHFKFVGDRKVQKIKKATSKKTSLKRSNLHEQLLSKYITLIQRTLEASPIRAGTTYEIYKNISKESKFCVSLSTIECILSNAGNHFSKSMFSDSLMLWTLKNNDGSSKILSRCLKVIKAVLRMSEAGAGTKQEIQKTLSKQCSYDMDLKTLQYVLDEFEGSNFQKITVGDYVFWENI